MPKMRAFGRCKTVLWMAATILLAPVARAQSAVPGSDAAVHAASGGDIVNYGEIHHPVIGRGGMVVAQNAYGAKVGVAILRKGGNAVDAAVAVAFAEAVSLARAGNLGGGGYMLVHMAAHDGKPAATVAIDYYGLAPHRVTPDFLLGANDRPDHAKEWSFKGVAVPGTVAGLWEAHQRFGKLPWADVVQPAIDLAAKGVVLSDAEADATAQQAKTLGNDPGARAIYLKPDGSPDKAGEVFRQPDLARTLMAIRDHGRDGDCHERYSARTKEASGDGEGHEGVPSGRTLEQGREARAVEAQKALQGAPGESELAVELAANPNNHRARHQLGVRRLLAGDHEAALECFLAIMRADRKFDDDLGRKSLIAAFALIDEPDLVSRTRKQMAAMIF